MELISRDEAIKQTHETFDNQEWATVANVVEKILIGVPTIEERKEGRWIFDEKGYFFCSECKRKPNSQYTTTDYCPNCGAKMERSE